MSTSFQRDLTAPQIRCQPNLQQSPLRDRTTLVHRVAHNSRVEGRVEGAQSGSTSLRASTVESAMAERASGWKLSALTERLGPPFDLGDVLVVLRRRSDLFLEWNGHWLSRAASLNQEPRRMRWVFDDQSTPPVWSRFHKPSAAAAGWSLFRDGIVETAFDPATAHLELLCDDGALAGVRLHVDHTVLHNRATWVLWCVTRDREILELLAAAGFFLWEPKDPQALVDVRHRVPQVSEQPGLTLASWCLSSPLDLADSLCWLVVDRSVVMSSRSIGKRVERVPFASDQQRAFRAAKGVWERRARGLTVAYCGKCGNPLSDPNSVVLGYGPECAQRLGLGLLRSLARGNDGVLFVGSVPLDVVRRRMMTTV